MEKLNTIEDCGHSAIDFDMLESIAKHIYLIMHPDNGSVPD